MIIFLQHAKEHLACLVQSSQASRKNFCGLLGPGISITAFASLCVVPRSPDSPSYSFNDWRHPNLSPCQSATLCESLDGKWQISLVLSNFSNFLLHIAYCLLWKSRKENPQKLTQLSTRSHPRHLVGKRIAQKDITIDTTSDSQVNSNFPNKWSPASLTFNNYFYLFLYLYIT